MSPIGSAESTMLILDNDWFSFFILLITLQPPPFYQEASTIL